MKPVLALLLVLALAGCTKPTPTPTSEPLEKPLIEAAVFFGDWQAQHLIPEPRMIPAGDAAARSNAVVGALLAGPTDPHLHRTIPPSVRLVEPVSVIGGVAQVNLSQELLEVRGAAAASQLLNSLGLSLTEIEGIERVQILVEGKAEGFLDEGIPLAEPLARPFLGDMKVLPDPSRIRYLQERVEKGEESWRLEPAKVLQFEGRMFGFTRERLAMAELAVEGDRAEARIPYRGSLYRIELTRNPDAATGPIWTITGIRAGSLP